MANLMLHKTLDGIHAFALRFYPMLFSFPYNPETNDKYFLMIMENV
jgi:hypothetical protein